LGSRVACWTDGNTSSCQNNLASWSVGSARHDSNPERCSDVYLHNRILCWDHYCGCKPTSGLSCEGGCLPSFELAASSPKFKPARRVRCAIDASRRQDRFGAVTFRAHPTPATDRVESRPSGIRSPRFALDIAALLQGLAKYAQIVRIRRVRRAEEPDHRHRLKSISATAVSTYPAPRTGCPRFIRSPAPNCAHCVGYSASKSQGLRVHVRAGSPHECRGLPAHDG
jgi:hypothetical protein